MNVKKSVWMLLGVMAVIVMIPLSASDLAKEKRWAEHVEDSLRRP